MREGHTSRGGCEGITQLGRAVAGQAAIIRVDAGAAVAEIVPPLGALAGLQTVLLAQLHQLALADQLAQQCRHTLAEIAAAGRQIFHQQVGQVCGGGTHAGGRGAIAR